jgi:hypothetical protein
MSGHHHAKENLDNKFKLGLLLNLLRFSLD